MKRLFDAKLLPVSQRHESLMASQRKDQAAIIIAEGCWERESQTVHGWDGWVPVCCKNDEMAVKMPDTAARSSQSHGGWTSAPISCIVYDIFIHLWLLFLLSKKMTIDAVRWSPMCKLVWPMSPWGAVLGAPETSSSSPLNESLRL